MGATRQEPCSVGGREPGCRNRALFVHAPGHLDEGGGGVQICTREYWSVLGRAGFDLEPIEVQTDRSFTARVRRRLAFRPYDWLDNARNRARLEASVQDVTCVFLNLRTLGPLAAWIRRVAGPRCRIVMLSHGLESTDYLHTIPVFGWRSRSVRRFGRLILDERSHNVDFDHVFCLSPMEVEMERWLGARSVSWLPRTVADAAPLDWRPEAGRIGFVGTIDHPPNRAGLVDFLLALERRCKERRPRVRIVGGPERDGRSLAGEFSMVDYLGPLPDDELRREAESWVCLVHPLFVHARGCSTKLAVALSWGIPVVTTPAGARGYSWREGTLPLAEDPESLAALAVDLLDPLRAALVREEVLRVRRSSPRVDEVARQVRCALGLDGPSALELA